MSRRLLFSIGVLSLFFACDRQDRVEGYETWTVYGGTKDMIRYSSLVEIDTSNVDQLEPLWVYRSGDADTANYSQIQCNPIVVNGLLYGVTPKMKLFALDAATGEHRWTFDPEDPMQQGLNHVAYHILVNSRGVTYWSADDGSDARIFFTAGSQTYAVDALSGKVIPSFGKGGFIDLHEGLDRDVADLFVVSTSPGTIYKDLLIMGTRVEEAPPAAPGHIRAYDVRTGEIRWIFHTIPHPGETGYESWEDPDAWQHIGGGNVWSGFSLDEARGILFAPTGSATYDFYGGKRKGANLYANCLLALDAATGKLIWHYQTMHHDVWDKDLPTPPALVQLKMGGKQVDAVAQPTKNGTLFVLDRLTGKPIFEVAEVAVDTFTDLIGEKLHPTQPVPVLPPAFSRQRIGMEEINPYLPEASQAAVRSQLATAKANGPYTPPSSSPFIVFPGFDGGGEWGGPSYDPATKMLYVNSNEMPWILQMLENPATPIGAEDKLAAGKRLYQQYCRSCHAANRAGAGNNPSLLGLAASYTPASLGSLLKTGRRMMPAFGHLAAEEVEALTTYILEIESNYARSYQGPKPADPATDPNYVPYKINGYHKFLSPEGLPAISPPWGQLTAINLEDGRIVWQRVLGQHPAYVDRDLPDLGSENYGGSVVTAGGLLFIAATADGKFRAFNKRTGELLWEYTLPSPAFATPAIYSIAGKQYIVLACGGGKMQTRAGDSYIAFGLPD